MCTLNLTTLSFTLHFNNLLPKHCLPLKVLLLVQLAIVNLLQFTELVASNIAYTQSEIIMIGVFCTHKPSFLKLGHILYYFSRITHKIRLYKAPYPIFPNH